MPTLHSALLPVSLPACLSYAGFTYDLTSLSVAPFEVPEASASRGGAGRRPGPSLRHRSRCALLPPRSCRTRCARGTALPLPAGLPVPTLTPLSDLPPHPPPPPPIHPTPPRRACSRWWWWKPPGCHAWTHLERCGGVAPLGSCERQGSAAGGPARQAPARLPFTPALPAAPPVQCDPYVRLWVRNSQKVGGSCWAAPAAALLAPPPPPPGGAGGGAAGWAAAAAP